MAALKMVSSNRIASINLDADVAPWLQKVERFLRHEWVSPICDRDETKMDAIIATNDLQVQGPPVPC